MIMLFFINFFLFFYYLRAYCLTSRIVWIIIIIIRLSHDEGRGAEKFFAKVFLALLSHRLLHCSLSVSRAYAAPHKNINSIRFRLNYFHDGGGGGIGCWRIDKRFIRKITSSLVIHSCEYTTITTIILCDS